MTALVGSWFLGLSNWFMALFHWRRLVWLAMNQRFLALGRRRGLGLILALAEPLIAVSVMYFVRGLLRARTPDYGTSLFLFFATGFLPYYLFLRLSTRLRNAGAKGRLPGLSTLDVYLAEMSVNAIIWIFMIVLIFFGMWWWGDIKEIAFVDVALCAEPIFLLILLALGIGMLNGAVSRYIPFWMLIYSLGTRGLVFLSGVLRIVDLQDPQMRAYSIINPLSHAIEWFRLGVWERYPHNSLDKGYLISWVVVCLFLGLVVDRASIRARGRR